jgi:O-antigen/teichoic acid export membrane protein
MSDPFNLRRNVTTSVFVFAANIVLVFFSYRLLVQQGGVGAVGLWSNLMAWIFIIRLGDVGMANAAVRFAASCDAASEPERVRRYVDTAFVMNAALFLVLAAIGWAVYAANLDVIVPSGPADQAIARSILPLMFTGFLLQNLSGLALGALRSIHRGYIAAWLTLAGTLAQLAIVLPLVPKIGLAGLAWGQVAQYALMLGGGWVWFLLSLRKTAGRAGNPLPVHVSPAVMREMIGFSLKAQFANITNGLFEPVSKIIIGRLGGLEALGLFELAFKAIALPRNAVVSGVQASVPAMTRLMATDRAEARKIYHRSMRTVTRAVAAVLGIVVLASPLASLFWLGRVDPDFVLFTAIIGLGFFINTTGAPAFVLGTASGRMRGNILAAAFSVAVMMAGVVSAGLWGPGWAMVVAVAVGLGGGGLYVRYLNEPLLESVS